MILAGRSASSFAAEIGSMRVSEQIDALEVMAVHPIQYLVTPRLWACVLMGPALTMSYNVVGMFGSWLVGVHYLGIDHSTFWTRVFQYVKPDDIYNGLIKGACFGAIIAMYS